MPADGLAPCEAIRWLSDDSFLTYRGVKQYGGSHGGHVLIKIIDYM